MEGLDRLVERLRATGVTVHDGEPLDGYLRVYVDDPFGNRIELLDTVRVNLMGNQIEVQEPARLDVACHPSRI